MTPDEIKKPRNVRMFEFLVCPAELWVRFCGFLCGVDVDEPEYIWPDDDDLGDVR